MRDAAEVQVERAIVHIVDHRKSKPVLSEVELDLRANETLVRYFSEQVANALSDDGTHSARFAEDDGSARDECYQILKTPRSFISSSQILATLLFDAMGEDGRIVPGSLAVCLYRASNYRGTRFLALIKLDPGDALRQKVTTVDGKRQVAFDVESNMMPTAREKLQKAALIAPAGFSDRFDLLLLDRQAVGTAAFFARKFLNTAPAFDPQTATAALYAAVQNARNRLSIEPPEGVEPLDLDTSFEVEEIMEAELRQSQVSLSGLIARLPVTDDQREVFKEEVAKELPGQQVIPIAPAFAQEKLLRKKRFRGDYGVRFEVIAQYYDEVVREVQEQRRPDGTPVTRLTIEVPRLKWVK